MKKLFWILIICSLVGGNKLKADDDPIPFEVNSVNQSANQEDSSYDKLLEESAKPKKELEVKKEVKTEAPTKAELTGLGRLSAFSDIAVINRRFLPKTHRFEIHPNFGLVLNDAFFTSFDLGMRLAFYFSEKYGVELQGMWTSKSNKYVTDELFVRGVETTAFASPTAYYGIDFKWIPIYGKMGWINRSIIPFDLYFSLGGGLTQTNQSTQAPSIHLGIGQLFALNKWLGVRWDISGYGYQSSYTINSGGNLVSGSGTFTNLHITLGASIFFPEAEYR